MSDVTLEDIQAAQQVIRGDAVHTPLLSLGQYDGRQLWVKPESLQSIGAFKIRGAMNAVAAAAKTADTVVTHSSGNHGQALAKAAQRYGVRAIVVIPDIAPAIKIEAVRALGAEVVIVPAEERAIRSAALVVETGGVMVAPFDDDLVIAGQGTVGAEIAADLPEAADQAVFVPVGGGGLLSGVAIAIKALRPSLKVIGVEPAVAGDAADSWAHKELRIWPGDQTSKTIADGLRTALCDRTWSAIERYVDDVVTVTEDQIVDAARLLFSRGRLVAEPSGAVATAGFLANKQYAAGGGVAVISGGNVDPAWFARHVLCGEPLAAG